MRILRIVAVLTVALAGAVVAWSTFTTSSARVSANTESDSLFRAGTLTLSQVNEQANLLLNADGLYPGLETDGCVEIAYDGSVPANVRLHGEPVGGTGLERFIDIQLAVSSVGETCADVGETSRRAFDGRLTDLWRRHPDYGQGYTLAPQAEAGTRLALAATATVIDDNDAQGLTTEFMVTIEVRP